MMSFKQWEGLLPTGDCSGTEESPSQIALIHSTLDQPFGRMKVFGEEGFRGEGDMGQPSSLDLADVLLYK